MKLLLSSLDDTRGHIKYYRRRHILPTGLLKEFNELRLSWVNGMLSMRTVCSLEFKEQQWEWQAVVWTPALDKHALYTHRGDKSETSVQRMCCPGCEIVVARG